MDTNRTWHFAFMVWFMMIGLTGLYILTENTKTIREISKELVRDEPKYIVRERSRVLVKEMQSETAKDGDTWTMIYRYQVNGVDSVAFLEDVNGNGDLSEELEEHRAYLRRFGEIVNEK